MKADPRCREVARSIISMEVAKGKCSMAVEFGLVGGGPRRVLKSHSFSGMPLVIHAFG